MSALQYALDHSVTSSARRCLMEGRIQFVVGADLRNSINDSPLLTAIIINQQRVPKHSDAYTAKCLPSTANCSLPTANCLLPTAYCLLPTAYCLMLTVYCLLYTAYCLLPTAYCLLLTVYCRLLTDYNLLPTAYC